jgi:hypothetical protein
MARSNPEEPTLFEHSAELAKAIGRQGLGHPASKYVILGSAVGGLIAYALPFLVWPLGLIAGAIFALVAQVKR